MSFEAWVVVPGASSLQATSEAGVVHSFLRISITVSAVVLPSSVEISTTFGLVR